MSSKNTPSKYDELKKNFQGEFMVNGMDLSKWVPTYKIINQKQFKNGNTIYYLRSDSEKTLFMNAFYWTVYNYMIHIGFDPESPFLFVSLNPRRKISNRYSIYKEKIYDRLVSYYKVINYGECVRQFLFVTARFFSNNIIEDLGFYIRCCSRTIDLITFPYVQLKDSDGNEIPANEFIHLLLLNMKYPLYIYEYNKVNGTLNRLVREYDHLVNQTHRYKKWRF